jgi:hypothetical protein
MTRSSTPSAFTSPPPADAPVDAALLVIEKPFVPFRVLMLKRPEAPTPGPPKRT